MNNYNEFTTECFQTQRDTTYLSHSWVFTLGPRLLGIRKQSYSTHILMTHLRWAHMRPMRNLLMHKFHLTFAYRNT